MPFGVSVSKDLMAFWALIIRPFNRNPVNEEIFDAG